MPLTRYTENAWHIDNTHDFFPRFRVARDYLMNEKHVGRASTVLLGCVSSSSSLAPEDNQRSPSSPLFRPPSPFHYSKRYDSKRRYYANGTTLYGWQSRGSMTLRPPAVAASSSWESFGSDSCSSLASSPFLHSSVKDSLSTCMTPMIPTADGTESTSTALNESSRAIKDVRSDIEKIARYSPEKDGFCLSNVSDSIDKLIDESLRRLPKRAPPFAECKPPANSREYAASPKNFQEGPSIAASEGWAAAAAAAAFAAASVSNMKDSLVGSPGGGVKTEKGNAIKLEPGDIDAFLRAKTKTEEVAARIRERVAAAREARIVMRFSPRARLSNGNSGKRTSAPGGSLRSNKRYACRDCNLPARNEIPPYSNPKIPNQIPGSVLSPSGRNKAAKLQPTGRGKHLLEQKKTEPTSVDPPFAENFLAVGMSMKPEGTKPQCAHTKPLTEKYRRKNFEPFSRTFAGVRGRMLFCSKTLHLCKKKSVAPVCKKKSVAPVSVAVYEEPQVVSSNPALMRSLLVADSAPHEKPLMQAATAIENSRSPAKAKHSVYVPARTKVLKSAKYSKTYSASAPISPISDPPRGNDAATAEEKAPGILTAATPTTSTTTTELTTAVQEEPAHVYPEPTGNQREGQSPTNRTAVLRLSLPDSNGCTVDSGKLPLTNATSNLPVANSQPAALRHLARVLCKAINNAAARELRNTSVAFFQRCCSAKHRLSSQEPESVVPENADAVEAKTPDKSKTLEKHIFTHGKAKQDHEQIDRSRELYPRCQSDKSCGLLETQLSRSGKCDEIKCAKDDIQNDNGSSCEQHLFRSLLHSNRINECPTSPSSYSASFCGANSPSCHVEQAEKREIPQRSQEPQKANIVATTPVSTPFQLNLSCLDDPSPVQWRGVSVTSAEEDRQLTAAVVVAVDSAEVQKEKVALHQQPADLRHAALQITGSNNKHPPPRNRNGMSQRGRCLSALSRDSQAESHLGGCVEGERRRKRSDEPTDLSDALLHRSNISFSCPGTPQCVAIRRSELGGKVIDIHNNGDNEAMTAVNQQLSGHSTALLPAAFSGDKVQGDSLCKPLQAQATASERSSGTFMCFQQVASAQPSSACRPGSWSWSRSELLDVEKSARRGHSVLSLATASIGEHAITLFQKEELENEGDGKRRLSAGDSPQAVGSTESVEPVQCSDTTREQLMLRSGSTCPMRDHQSELDQLRQPLDAHRQSLAEHFRRPHFTRTKAETCSVPHPPHPSMEHSVEPQRGRVMEQQKMRYEQVSPEVPAVADISLNRGPKEYQTRKVDEGEQEKLGDKGALGRATLVMQLADTVMKSQDKQDYCFSLEAQTQNLQHQVTHHHPDKTSRAVREVLWGLLDRMEFIKENFASAEHLKALREPIIGRKHQPQRPKEFSKWPGAPSSFQSHLEHPTHSLQPSTCQKKADQFHMQELTQLCVMGKSMGNGRKKSAAQCLSSAEGNTPQHVRTLLAPNQTPTGSFRWKGQHMAASKDKIRVRNSVVALPAQQAVVRKGSSPSQALEQSMVVQNRDSGAINNDESQPLRATVKRLRKAEVPLPGSKGEMPATNQPRSGPRGRRLCRKPSKFRHPVVGCNELTCLSRQACVPFSTGKEKKECIGSDSPSPSPIISATGTALLNGRCSWAPKLSPGLYDSVDRLTHVQRTRTWAKPPTYSKRKPSRERQMYWDGSRSLLKDILLKTD